MSIVGVDCKCLLRVSIVSVYCVSLENVKKAMVLLCVRLKVMKNNGFIVCSLKSIEK